MLRPLVMGELRIRIVETGRSVVTDVELYASVGT
jgi:hypothetical protein